MAEASLVNLSSRILSTICSPVLRSNYPFASEQLEKIRIGIATIEAVMRDVVDKHEEPPAVVKSWIQRVSDVLFTVEDEFDEAVARLVQARGQAFSKEVRRFFSRSNQFSSSLVFALKVKEIRKSLDRVCRDIPQFDREKRQYKGPSSVTRSGVGTGWLINQTLVVGRDHDMELIKEMIFGESNAEENVSIIAIVGMMGIGKTTVAQLIYNHEEAQKNFEARWWACVSNSSDEAEIIGRIVEAITGEFRKGLSSGQFETHIQEFKRLNKKFLLVIDDLELKRCQSDLRFLLDSFHTRGSKIIVTTRSTSVAIAINVDRIYQLNGLSEDTSWDLFRRIAFTREQENDPSWNILGRKIVKKCYASPFAIRAIGSLLYSKTSKEEWRSFLEGFELEVIGEHLSPVMSTLRLCFDFLPLNLKLCFSYCSLYPKDYKICKNELIYLWIAQGYINPNNGYTREEEGHACLQILIQRSFLLHGEGENGEVLYCKMHDLMHDLAQLVAERESIVLTEGLDQFHKANRHASVDYEIDSSWEIPKSLLDADRLRSCLFWRGGWLSPLVLNQLVTRFKFLRTMDLRDQNIEVVPSLIGWLRHLRYLNLSGNRFRNLPDSITKLLNLLTLDISSCEQLEVLPASFRRLINLRHLNTKNCDGLRYMPPRFGELDSLQHLSCFKVGKVVGGVTSSGLNALGRLGLTGQLQIMFDNDIDDWLEDESWQLPPTLQGLEICFYPGMRMPNWDQNSLPNIVRLHLYKSSTMKHLPPLWCLPQLRALHLSCLNQLTYIEDENENESRHGAHLFYFFPRLEDLKLTDLPKLMSWSSEVEAITTSKDVAAEEYSSCTDPPDQMLIFPVLSNLKVEQCPMLQSLPLSPRLQALELQMTRMKLMQNLLSACSRSVETVTIHQCDSLNSFPGETLTSLRRLQLTFCNELKNLHLPLPQHNVLEELVIQSCPQLKLWEGKKGGVDWDSLINLRVLSLDDIPDVEMLPSCLQHHQSLRKLVIRHSDKSTSLIAQFGSPSYSQGLLDRVESLCTVDGR